MLTARSFWRCGGSFKVLPNSHRGGDDAGAGTSIPLLLPSIFAHALFNRRNADVTDHIFQFALAARKLRADSQFTADKHSNLPVHVLCANPIPHFLSFPVFRCYLFFSNLSPFHYCCLESFPKRTKVCENIKEWRAFFPADILWVGKECVWEWGIVLH